MRAAKMRTAELVIASITNYRYFRRLPLDRKKKLLIFVTFLKIALTYLFFVKLFHLRIRRTHIMGMKVEAYDYASLCYLYNEIFFRGEYAFRSSKAAPVIFDCGANVGIATLFFKWLYPEAIVFAFEPEPDAFALLTKNIIGNKLSSVHLYNAALTQTVRDVAFYADPGTKASLRASMLAERTRNTPISVQGLQLSQFLASQMVDFLKIDIEGAEIEVFDDLCEHRALEHVRELVVEYHHHITPDDSMLGRFLANLEASGFDYQLDARCIPVCSQGQFQDMVIYSYRSDTAQAPSA
jgi:FkbM family methyltransferase